MREPKYEPLKMGNKIHADNYGIKMRKYRKWKDEQIKTQNKKEKFNSDDYIYLGNVDGKEVYSRRYSQKRDNQKSAIMVVIMLIVGIIIMITQCN